MSKKLTTDEFTEKYKSSKFFKTKYDLSEVNYINSCTKISINCTEEDHGYFTVTPNNFISKGAGCPRCVNNKKSTTEDFKNKVKLLYGNKYDLSIVEYIDNSKKVIIGCSKHGNFSITPNNFLSGKQCSKCTKENNWSRSGYINKANNRKCTFYILRCFNKVEQFYKIGITMKSVRDRYCSNKSMPYSYEIISEIHGEAGEIWDLELLEKRKLKAFHYLPRIKFGGYKTECFTQYKN